MAKVNQEEFKCLICVKTFFSEKLLDDHAKVKHKR